LDKKLEEFQSWYQRFVCGKREKKTPPGIDPSFNQHVAKRFTQAGEKKDSQCRALPHVTIVGPTDARQTQVNALRAVASSGLQLSPQKSLDAFG